MKRRDTERLDWLQDKVHADKTGLFEYPLKVFVGKYNNLRKCIDAAMKSEQKEQRS